MKGGRPFAETLRFLDVGLVEQTEQNFRRIRVCLGEKQTNGRVCSIVVFDSIVFTSQKTVKKLRLKSFRFWLL